MSRQTLLFFDLVLVLTSTFIGVRCLESTFITSAHTHTHTHTHCEIKLLLVMSLDILIGAKLFWYFFLKVNNIYKIIVGVPILLVWFSIDALDSLKWYFIRLLSFLCLFWFISRDVPKDLCWREKPLTVSFPYWLRLLW